MAEQNREKRELDTRATSARPAKWMPPQLLPDPIPEPGYAFPLDSCQYLERC
jgi:hypothetical protein